MRALIVKTLILSAAATAACAEIPPDASAPRAVSVERFAQPATEVRRERAHGYSADTRRQADCLATYPGYDVETDRIRVSSGVTRRCPL